MARPPKGRKVCQMPRCGLFGPLEGEKGPELGLTVEEYEVLRLIDLEDFSQAECAGFIGAARTTVQAIYADARRKVARMLVEGRPLRISGGAYTLCAGGEETCRCGGCEKHRAKRDIPGLAERKETNMRIAVTYENGEIFQHFGHTAQFKCYDVEGGQVVASQVVDTNGSGHGALAGFLQAAKADALICGGIGPGAKNALQEAGIKLYGGVCGSADEAVAALLAGTLQSTSEPTCDHHDHGEGHTCGDHGCGSHGCHH